MLGREGGSGGQRTTAGRAVLRWTRWAGPGSPGNPYFTDNCYSSYFSLNSHVVSDGGVVALKPFIRVYNRMFKYGANTAMDFKTFGNSNSGVNSDL